MAKLDKGPTLLKRVASLEQSRLHILSQLKEILLKALQLKNVTTAKSRDLAIRATELEARMDAMEDHHN